jgi:hypothetical protein
MKTFLGRFFLQCRTVQVEVSQCLNGGWTNHQSTRISYDGISLGPSISLQVTEAFLGSPNSGYSTYCLDSTVYIKRFITSIRSSRRNSKNLTLIANRTEAFNTLEHFQPQMIAGGTDRMYRVHRVQKLELCTCRQSRLQVALLAGSGHLTSLHLEHVSGLDSCDLRTIGQHFRSLGEMNKYFSSIVTGLLYIYGSKSIKNARPASNKYLIIYPRPYKLNIIFCP